jgi:Mn2+/Fe2+ NRAMP family transporter
MSMKNIVLAGVAATFMAGSAVAAEPVTLTDAQLDNVTGGIFSVVFGTGLIGPSLAVGEAVTGTTLTQFATSDQFSISPDATALATLTSASARNDVQLRSISSGGGLVGNVGSIAIAGFIQVP